MSRHPHRLSEAGISPARYQELQAICRQYPNYLREIKDARAGIVDKPRRRSGAWRQPDPTGNAAVHVADSTAWASARVRLIEHCAHAVAEPVIAAALLKSVSEEREYEQLRPPCGRRQFYILRQLFYIELDWREKLQDFTRV